MDRPTPPPEAALLRRVRAASGLQSREAAAEIGHRFNRTLSPSRWSQIENGYETRGGEYKPVTANAATLAQMFAVIGGVTPERLAGEGQRPDAAEILSEILRRRADDSPPASAPPDEEDEEEDEALRAIMADTRIPLPRRRAIVAYAKKLRAENEQALGLSRDTA